MTGSLRGMRAQAMTEFALTIGLLMLVVVLTAELAIYLHYHASLDAAAREGAFQAALAGNSPDDGEQAARDLWRVLEPGGAPITVKVSREGEVVVVTAQGLAPSLLPVPIPPYRALPISARAVHQVERFQPGSAP